MPKSAEALSMQSGVTAGADCIAPIAYAGRAIARPRYHANDSSRDQLEIVPVYMPISNARGRAASLDDSGFTLVAHRSGVADFGDRSLVERSYRSEVLELIAALSGAELVVVNGPAILRFSERSPRSGKLDNSRPARFAHVDVSDATAAEFARRAAPADRAVRRYVHFNIWRCISAPPQDVPLAVCDARSVCAADLIAADAVFDSVERPEWSFEGIVVAHNSAHRWHWFADMTVDEALVFKTHDSDPAWAHCVPHVAFDSPLVAADVAPRASIEMRAIAFWFQDGRT